MTIECRPMTLKSRDVFWQRMRIIQESRLRLKHKAVLIWLLVYAGDDDECNPHQSALAAAVGVPVREIQRITAELRHRRLLFTTRGLCEMKYEVDWIAVKNAGPISRKQRGTPLLSQATEPATPGEG